MNNREYIQSSNKPARYYYAMECPRGCTTASKGDRLRRFATSAARAALVSEAFEGVDYVDQCKRDEVTREEARRWFPAAFSPSAVTFPAFTTGDYWDRLEAESGAEWSGEPTGGVYADAAY